MNKGRIVQVIGPVVDVEFPDRLPRINNDRAQKRLEAGAADGVHVNDVAEVVDVG